MKHEAAIYPSPTDFRNRNLFYLKTIVVVFLLASLGIYMGLKHFLIFHTSIELFSVIIAFSVLIIASNSFSELESRFLLLLGIAYGFVGGFDFLHTLAYKGLGVFPGNTSNLATQLWLIARYLESISLFIACISLGKKLNTQIINFTYGVVSVFLLLLVFYFKTFPVSFIEGVGLTLFKKISEFVIISIILIALFVLKKNKEHIRTVEYKYLSAAYVTTIFGEISFTLYMDVYGLFNIIGHLFKLLSFYFIYRAITESHIRYPFEKLKLTVNRLHEEKRGRAHAENELNKIRQDIARLDRLNLVGEIAAGISHEVRNPMTTVRGYLQLWKERDNYEEHTETIDLMISELDRANSIISEFLSIGSNKISPAKQQNLTNIIDSLLPLMQADAISSDKYIDVNLEKTPDLILNENEIRQLILNLVRNGLDAIAADEKIIISTSTDENNVVLAIKDQGKGIPPQVMEKLGTPFYTTKKNGTGLGLSICHSVALKHQAQTKVETGPKGTTFYVCFPVQKSTESA